MRELTDALSTETRELTTLPIDIRDDVRQLDNHATIIITGNVCWACTCSTVV
jgi:hypothetical protein